MPLVKRCHDRARQSSSHVITSVTVEDDADTENQLVRNVSSIEEKLDQNQPQEVDQINLLIRN
jgi:uncharacterized protein YqgV (UPF0045/DUF77 family)